jgi:peptide subunit release factor 1 (eRF1)
MASTVSWDGLRDLAGFHAEKGCVISLYVCLDPSIAPTPADAHARVRSLLDEAGKSAGASRDELTRDQRQALRSDLERIRDYFEGEFARNGAHGFALFASGLDGFWSPLALAEPVPDAIRIGRAPNVAPLVALVGRGEGALVCAVSRERGEIYELREGRLEEVASLRDEQTRGHDQGSLSQARQQRYGEKELAEHLRRVAGGLERRLRASGSPQVVIVASEGTRSELEPLLAADLRAAAAWAHAEAHAGPPELLEVARPLLERGRAERERAAIERWSEELSRGGRAVGGWKATLEAASDGRVDLLLCADGVEHPGRQCPVCGRAAAEPGACPLDGTPLEETDAGLDLAVHQTLAHGGTVWAVQHSAELEPVEGIGALLRF